MVSSVASLFIRFYLVITKAWKDIPHAFELLKRDGLPSFINRFFYYLNGIRLPQTEDRSVESTSKKVIFCCSNEVSEIRLSNSEIPKFLHFVFGYETAVLAAGKFSLAAVRTLNSFTSLRFYGLSFASAKNPETDIKSLKSKNYNFAVCNNLKACHFLTYFKAQNIISLVILNKHELNQNPEALFPELNFIVENADVIAVDSESAKKIIHDLGIDSAKIIVLSPKNKNTADNTKASLNELSSYEIYIRSLLSLLLNVSDSNNPAPAESIVKLAESSQLSFTKKNNIAIILHLYYFDLMEEICTYLNNITQPFDLYISVNPAASEESVKTLQALFPDSCIYVFENRGRDIAPFLEIFKKIIPLNYKYICKIHSKQSPHFSDTSGIAWRTGTFASLLGNSSIVNRILNYFDKHPEIGIIAPENFLFLYRDPHNINIRMIDFFAEKLSIPVPRKFYFPAGTMFWFRAEALYRLPDLGIKPSDFLAESNAMLASVDGSLAHAAERLIPLCAIANGFGIIDTASI